MTRKAARRTLRGRGLWLWSPVALLAALFAAPACGPEFTGCEAYRSCNETGGSAAGGAGGSSAGSGGTSGRFSGGSDAGGEPGASGGGAGGSGEAGSGGVGGSGGSGETGAAGAAGAGGAGGASELCADEGTVECAAAASAFVRTCTAGVWARTQCAAGSLCDGSDATCKAVVGGCVAQRAGDSFCEGDKRRVCGPDLVTTTDQVCEGACVDGACKKPACGDGKLEGVEACDDGNLTPGDGCSATCRAEPVAVELGATFGCALLADQRLKCWGDSRLGQLGLGDALARGDQAGELGSSLTATLSDVTAFAVGPRHACAVSEAETWCWGDNSKYALGTGSLSPTLSRVPIKVAVGATPIALAAGEDFTCALLADASLRCWGSNTGEVFGPGAAYQPATAQAALPRLVLGSAASAILAGQSLCANSVSGLVCSGALFPSAAYAMNLGPGFTPAGASSGAHHDCAWSTNGKVHCWGAERGPLGLNGELAAADGVATASTVPLAKAVSALDAGVNVTCAVLSAGEVECWGSTETGVLGRPDLGTTIGASAFLGDEVGEIGLLRALELGDNGVAKAVAVGQGFACALLKRGVLKCWGSNAYGQLGHGDTQIAGDQVGEMGNALPDTVLD